MAGDRLPQRLEDVLALISDLSVGPIRDIGLLASAVHRPQVSVFGDDAYPDIDSKVAVLLESLVRSQYVVNGNKRLGWLATVVFYGLNGISLDAPDDDACNLVIAIASSTTTYQQAGHPPRQMTPPAEKQHSGRLCGTDEFDFHCDPVILGGWLGGSNRPP